MKTNKKNKKSINWGKIGAIATVIGVVVAIVIAIIELWPPKTDPHESILNSIKEIRESFLPSEIHSELDSNVFVNTYKEFQTNVLDVCDAWEMLESKLLHAEPANYEDYNKSSCKGRLELYQKGMKEMNDQMMMTIMYVMSLSIGSETFHEQSSWKINIDEFGYLTNLVKLKDITSNKYLTNAARYIDKGQLRKSMTEIDKMKKDKDYLMFDDAFFKYCIQVKETCDNILKDNGIRY